MSKKTLGKNSKVTRKQRRTAAATSTAPVKGLVIANDGEKAIVIPQDGTGNRVTFVRDPEELKAHFLEYLPLGKEIDLARASIEDEDTLSVLEAFAAAGTPLTKEQMDAVLRNGSSVD